MLNSPVLDVAISLIFIYLLVALMVTGITQFIFSLRKTKSALLKDALHNLFFDPNWKEISERLINSPSIQILKKRKDKFPNFIPPKVFANALLDTITLGKPTMEVVNSFLEKDNGEFGTWLRMVVSQSENSIVNLKQELAGLFDNAMDSVTSWYTREAKWWSRGIALLICAVINIDSVDIVEYFFNNPAAATQTADSASQFVANNELESCYIVSGKDTLQTFKLISNQNNVVTDTTAKGIVPGNNGKGAYIIATPTVDKTIKKAPEQDLPPTLKTGLITLKAQPIPIGWKRYFEKIQKEKELAATLKSSHTDRFSNFLTTLQNILLKITGIFLSAGAVSLGAPFWFDLLQKLTPLRKKQADLSKATA